MMNSKQFSRITGFTIALLIVSLLILPAFTAKAEGSEPIGVAVCTAKSSLKLYTTPSTRSKVLAKLPARVFVKVYAQSGKWYQVEYNGIMAWGSISYLSYAPLPAATTRALSTSPTYTTYYQGASVWKFSRSVRKSACLLSSYAITINNMGIPATPRFVYESNGRRTIMSMKNLSNSFGVTAVCALAGDSPYLKSFDGWKTLILDPGNNGEAAIREAIDRHPEGVICYFKKGSKSHGVVACCYDSDTIYFSDPGRSCDELVTFKDTWVQYKHKMTYEDLAEVVALDTVEQTMTPPETPAAPPVS